MAYSSGRPAHSYGPYGTFYDSREERERLRSSEPRSHVSYADQPESTRERNSKSYMSRSTRDRDYYDNADDSRFSTAHTVVGRDSEYARSNPRRESYMTDLSSYGPSRQRGSIPRSDPFDSLDTFQAWTLACEYDLHTEAPLPFGTILRPIDGHGQTKTKVAVTQQSLSQETIKDDVRDLDRDMPLPQKLLRLTAEELQQVETLVEHKNAFEADSQYEWVVAQLNCFTSSSVSDWGAPKRRNSTMLYLKRTPKPHVNRGELHRQKNPKAEGDKPLPNPSHGSTGPPRGGLVLEDSEDKQGGRDLVKKKSDYLEAWVLADDSRRKKPLNADTLPPAFRQFMSQDDLNEAARDVAQNAESIVKCMLRFKTPILARITDLITWKTKSETDRKYEWLLAGIIGADIDSDSDESGSDSGSDHPRKHGRGKQSAVVFLKRAVKSGPVTQMRFEDVKEAKSPATTAEANTSQTQEPSKPKPDPENNETSGDAMNKPDHPPTPPHPNDDGWETTFSRESTYHPAGPSTSAPAPKPVSTTASPIATPSSSNFRSNNDNIPHYQPSAATPNNPAPTPSAVYVAVASQEPTVHASGSEVVPPSNGGIRRRAGFTLNQPQRRESDVGLPIAEPDTHTNGSQGPNGRPRSTRSTGRATITRLFGSRSSLFQRPKHSKRGGDSDDENDPDPPNGLPNPNPSHPPKTSRWTKACLLIFTLLLSSAFFIGGVSFDRTLQQSSSQAPAPTNDFLEVLVNCIWHVLSVFFSYCALIWHRRKHSLPNTFKSLSINSLFGVEIILLIAGTSGPITTGVWFKSVAYCKLTSLLGNALLAFANLAMIFLEESVERDVVEMRREKGRNGEVFMLQGVVVGRQNGTAMNGSAMHGIRMEDSGIGTSTQAQSLQITTATTRVGSDAGSQYGGEAWDNVPLS